MSRSRRSSYRTRQSGPGRLNRSRASGWDPVGFPLPAGHGSRERLRQKSFSQTNVVRRAGETPRHPGTPPPSPSRATGCETLRATLYLHLIRCSADLPRMRLFVVFAVLCISCANPWGLRDAVHPHANWCPSDTHVDVQRDQAKDGSWATLTVACLGNGEIPRGPIMVWNQRSGKITHLFFVDDQGKGPSSTFSVLSSLG